MCVTRSYPEPDTLKTNFRIKKKCPEMFSLEQKHNTNVLPAEHFRLCII